MTSTGTTSIKKLAIRGAIWTMAAYGASQILRFGSNLILTRLLYPDLFGLMSLVNVFITGLNLFSDLGIGPNVVQSKRGDDSVFLNTAWTVQILRGLLLWLFCLLLAIPASRIYNEPLLGVLLPIVGFNAVLGGFNSTAIFSLNRHLSFKQITLYELSAQIVSLAVVVTWSLIHPSIWALVAGGLTSAIVELVMSHRLNKGEPNRFTWDRSAASELLSFGKWVFVSTAMAFMANQSDRLILGKLFPLELLGVYGVAFALADMPRSILLALSGKVIFPSYAKMIDLPRPELRGKILRNRLPIVLVLAVGLAVFISYGDLLVSTLYDNRYAAAAWMLPLLLLGAWPIMLTQTIDPVLIAMGRPQYIALACFHSSLCYFIGIPLGFSLYGPVGAIMSIAASNVPVWIAINYALWREQISPLKQDILVTAIFLAALILILGSRFSFDFQSVINHFTQ